MCEYKLRWRIRKSFSSSSLVLFMDMDKVAEGRQKRLVERARERVFNREKRICIA